MRLPRLFQVTIEGKPIRPPDKAISSGVEMGIALPGFVPLFEEHEARVTAGYTLTAWRRLRSTDRALEVAHLRLRRMIHMQEEAAVAREVHKRPRRGGR
jgi:hypothetical protein